ncbi:MAG: DUF1802 family protein [Phycisphaeraceae bacterium]|nr:DUF1802 family protein [Phycisphaeraceae bacterium]
MSQLDVALKEWKIVWELVREGRFALLIRKGGIHERGGGGFEVRHQKFACFPAWEHQRPEMIKSDWRERVVVQSEPEEVTLKAWAEPARIWQLTDRSAFDQLDELHPWTDAQIDMRFNYKPERPLWLMAVRAYDLAEPVTIPNRKAYAGCRSWVDLKPEDAVEVSREQPVMTDQAFKAVTAMVDLALGAGERPAPPETG